MNLRQGFSQWHPPWEPPPGQGGISILAAVEGLFCDGFLDGFHDFLREGVDSDPEVDFVLLFSEAENCAQSMLRLLFRTFFT